MSRSSGSASVAIVGGGPAGLMAAEGLAASGMDVGVYDARRSMGRKLLLAGRSGLNLTNDEPIDDFVAHFEPRAPLMEAALRRFDPGWLRSWAAGMGETTFVGSGGRVFPESFRAAPLLRTWLRRLAAAGVTFHPGHRWTGWTGDGRLSFEVAGAEVCVEADATVLALGGASWPRVGGDGGWTALLADRGVSVVPLRAGNCGVEVDWSSVFIERFEAAPVKNVVVWCGDRSRRGEIVVTRAGLEGGPIYAMGPALRPLVGRAAAVTIDFAPDLDVAGLAVRLSGRRPKETQSSWLRRAGLAPVAVGLLRESTGNRLPDDAGEMAALAKAATFAIRGLAPLDRAISTAGGVAGTELDDHFMLRRLPGVFVAGEMLDWDAPTGGYLLQGCCASGAAAAEGVRRFVGGISSA